MVSLAEVVDYLLPKQRDASRPRSSSLENPGVSLSDENAWEMFGHSRTDSGMSIGPEDALRFGPVLQCLLIKSGDIGSSTLHCHKNEAEPGESDIDTNQSAEQVCSLEWNETTPANEGWANLVFHQQLFGDGYAYIAKEGGSPNGRILWMANLVPTAVTLKILKERGNALVYELQVDGQPELLNPWEVFHLRSLQLQPKISVKLYHLMRNEIGLALAGKKFLSKFFERGGHHGGILTVKDGVSEKAIKTLESGVAKRANPSEWFKTMVLRDGATWQAATVDPRAAQMHELNEDEAREVCHFFNMPPWKIGLRNAESYNSAEQAQRSYITGTLGHLSTMICGEAQMKLLARRTRRARSHRFEHNFSKLLQADVKTLNEVLAIQRSAEIISANEWRKKINLPERADEKASEFYNPNTRSETPPEDDDGDNGKSNRSTGKSQDEIGEDAENSMFPPFRALMQESIGRVAKRMSTVARNKARKPNELLAWVDSIAADHQGIVDEELRTPLQCVTRTPDVLLLASRTWFATTLTKGLNQFLSAPHLTQDLERNVEQFCTTWTASAADQWFEEIYNAKQ